MIGTKALPPSMKSARLSGAAVEITTVVDNKGSSAPMKRVLIANRGEIACRIIRSCRSLGLESVAVYSDADEHAMHVAEADVAHHIGAPSPLESYLLGDGIIAAAKATGADAIHPGYGFLAENAGFAKAVSAAGLTWIGPHHKSIEDMGDKERARLLAKAAGVPILPGSPRFSLDEPDTLGGLEDEAEKVGYPLLVKASAGGGGIGMQRVDNPDRLKKVVSATQAMASRSFGDGTIFLERFVARARHIEIQVFGFGDGRVVHFHERDCSVQRRFQKVVEESPAPGLRDDVRQKMIEAATALAGQERYLGAGTVEFVFDADTEEFFFLEMNTRIQVEHPVSEMVTGVDLVGLQLQLARGDDLTAVTQDSISSNGHAIEVRIYAENPDKKFFPSPGKLDVLEFPVGDENIRVDTGVRQGDEVTVFYDPMIAKLITYGPDRGMAITHMLSALADLKIEGLVSNKSFLAKVIGHDGFGQGDFDTGFIEKYKAALLG
jgi:3-methylcrotonyl-CoA carboxylase alpha subunit